MKKYFITQSSRPILRGLSLGIMLLALLASGFQVRLAHAAAPATGVVEEGLSVPGIKLGFTRAQVEASYGAPASCQSGGVIGNMSLCKFYVEGGGTVFVHYRGADGGEASNSPDDVANNVRWYGADGWVTTAGVNTTLALEDPQAVMAAYPNATVTYNSLFGNIESIEDRSLGILIDYHFSYLTGDLSVAMVIMSPSTEPPPPPEDIPMRVAGIEFAAGKNSLTATVKVQDDLDRNVFGATVSATWTLPGGKTESVEGVTYGFGTTQFEVKLTRKGAYTLSIEDIELDGYQFDKEASVLSATYMK
jgi:hypothetical protein